MRKIVLIGLSALLLACNPLAKLPGILTNADTAYDNSDLQKAYNLYHQYIEIATNNNSEVNDDIYLKLAQVSGKLDKIDEAGQLYSKLLQKEEHANLIMEYAQLLQGNGKIQKEIELWNQYEGNEEKVQVQKAERLVALYTKTESYEGVIEAYSSKGDLAVSNEATMAYISALELTDNKVEAAKACNALVKSNPDYVPGLEWKAKYYYEKADERYKYEMAKYNKNKNATTYAYLLRDLKKVSADFRIARDTFEQLRKIDPEDKSYIKYLKNCYLRLEQKGEAAKMDRLLK